MPRPDYFTATVTDRPYHQKYFYSRISQEDAQRKADLWRQAHDNPVYVKQLAPQWLESIKPDKSPQNFTSTYETPTNTHIIPALGEYMIIELDEDKIKAFYRSKAELSQSLLDKLKLCLSGMLEYAAKNNLVLSNKAAEIKPTSKQDKANKRVLSQKQLTEYSDAIETDCPEAALIILTGMRIGELCGIRTDDIKDLDPDIVPIYRSIMPDGKVKPPKSKHARFIPCKQAADLIHRISLNTPHGYLFGNGETPPLPATIAARITRAFKRLGLPDLTPHELRHTFATNFMRHSKNIYKLQQLLGHSSVTVTEGYIKNEIDPLREAMKEAGLY